MLQFFVYYYYYIFGLGFETPSGLLFFRAFFASFYTHASLLTFFVCFFVLFGKTLECLGKHSCMSSPFPIAILNGTFIFRQCDYKCIMCILSEKLEIVKH